MSDRAIYASRDTRTGLVLALLVIVAAAVAWVMSRPVSEGPLLLVEYDDVVGLTRGDAVTLNGLQVGQVEGIATEFLDMGGIRFTVALRLSEDLRFDGDALRLNQGTQAVIVPPALPVLGGARVLLLPDFEGSDRLLDGDIIFGTADTALLDAISAQFGSLIFSVNRVTADLGTLLDSMEVTRSEADRTMRLVQTEVPRVTAQLESELATVGRVLGSVETELTTTGTEVRSLLDSLTVLASDAGDLLESVDRTVNTRVPDVDLLIARLDSTSYIVQHLVQRLSERPLRVLWGVDIPDSIPLSTGRGGG